MKTLIVHKFLLITPSNIISAVICCHKLKLLQGTRHEKTNNITKTSKRKFVFYPELESDFTQHVK